MPLPQEQGTGERTEKWTVGKFVVLTTTLRTVYTRAPLIACNLVTKVHHLTDEGQASHMRNQCFFTHEAMAP